MQGLDKALRMINDSGELERLRNGDIQVFTCNDGTIIFAMDKGEFEIQVIPGKPIKLDVNIDLLEKSPDK